MNSKFDQNKLINLKQTRFELSNQLNKLERMSKQAKYKQQQKYLKIFLGTFEKMSQQILKQKKSHSGNLDIDKNQQKSLVIAHKMVKQKSKFINLNQKLYEAQKQLQNQKKLLNQIQYENDLIGESLKKKKQEYHYLKNQINSIKNTLSNNRKTLETKVKSIERKSNKHEKNLYFNSARTRSLQVRSCIQHPKIFYTLSKIKF